MKDKMNVSCLRTLIDAGTMYHTIKCLQIKVSAGRITISMVSNQRDAVVLINQRNTLTNGTDIELNFAEPYIQVLPYLPKDGYVEFQIDDNALYIKSFGISRIPLCHLSSIQNNVLYKSYKDDFDYFHTLRVNKHMLSIFADLIKKGKRFETIYVEVKDRKLYIWVGDATNQFAPRHTHEICKCDYEDLLLCFEKKNFVNFLKGVHIGSLINLAYIKDTEGGLMHLTDGNSGIKFMLLNREL